MPHKLKYVSISLAALLFITPVCHADQPSFLDWRSDDFLFAENRIAGISEKHVCVCGGTGGSKPCGACRMTDSCHGSDAEKNIASMTPRKKSIDLGDIHKYLGYTTVLLVGLAAATAGDNGAHYGAAYGSAVAAAGTVATGFLEYGDRFDLSYGLFSEDNAHIILGTVGAIACIAAVAVADSDGGGGHAGAGGGGGVAMALSIVTIRW